MLTARVGDGVELADRASDATHPVVEKGANGGRPALHHLVDGQAGLDRHGERSANDSETTSLAAACRPSLRWHNLLRISGRRLRLRICCRAKMFPRAAAHSPRNIEGAAKER